MLVLLYSLLHTHAGTQLYTHARSRRARTRLQQEMTQFFGKRGCRTSAPPPLLAKNSRERPLLSIIAQTRLPSIRTQRRGGGSKRRAGRAGTDAGLEAVVGTHVYVTPAHNQCMTPVKITSVCNTSECNQCVTSRPMRASSPSWKSSMDPPDIVNTSNFLAKCIPDFLICRDPGAGPVLLILAQVQPAPPFAQGVCRHLPYLLYKQT